MLCLRFCFLPAELPPEMTEGEISSSSERVAVGASARFRFFPFRSAQGAAGHLHPQRAGGSCPGGDGLV